MINKDYQAVKLGVSADRGYYSRNTRFAYIYTFINRNDNKWETEKAVNNVSGLAVIIPAGTTYIHHIKMDEDYNFEYHSMAFTVYYYTGVVYEWYDNVTSRLDASVGEIMDPQYIKGIPLLHYINCSFSVHAPDGKYLWGGKNNDTIVRAGDLTPIDLQTLQGESNGFAQTPTPHLIPRSGVVKLELTNTHASKTLKVGGALYGMKVRI